MEPLKIDVDAVLRQRLPRYYRWLPRPLIAWVERLICQDRLNRMLIENAGKTGADFCKGVLDHLKVTAEWSCTDALPDPDESRVIYVSNHPLGGLDGMALTAMVRDHHGIEPWFLVNDLLMAVEPLRPVFLPVNKHGRQNRAEVEAINSAMLSERPVIIFPAGLVSRRGADGSVADLGWKKKFVEYAVRYRRDIIPLHFSGLNTPRFYRMARLRQRSGMKFNIEMILLPGEMFKAEGSHFDVLVGERVHWETLGGVPARKTCAQIRSICYSLPVNH